MTYTNLASLLLRLGFGGMMLPHGWGKLNYLFSEDPSFPDPFGIGEMLSLVLAVFAEFFCSILLIIGLKSRLASIPLAFTMLVAAFIIHADDPWGKQEFPLLFFIGFVGIFLLGSGKYSLDWKIKKV